MSNTESFQIYYDGPALTSHEMDVRDLAPALVAVSDLLEEANRIIYGDKTKVQVNVKGSFKSGSFHVDFSLVQELIQQVQDLFGISRDASTQLVLGLIGIPTASGVLNGAAKGLIQLVKWIGNRKIKSIEKTKNGSNLKITIDNESVEVYPEVLQMYQNIKIRKSLEVIISKPLQKAGIDVFAFRSPDENQETRVEKEIADVFTVPDTEDEKLEDEVYTTDVQLTLVSFKEGNKWKFTDGNVEFTANVNDEAFVRKVQDSKASFSKDDILKVRIKKKKWISDTGIKSEYEIEEVISHRPSNKQIPLFIESDDQE